jgi:hypothetical protein
MRVEHELHVSIVSPEEAEHGIAEFWAGGELFGFTRLEDAASALASRVTFSPALFVNGERYPGELDSAAVTGAIEAAPPRA